MDEKIEEKRREEEEAEKKRILMEKITEITQQIDVFLINRCHVEYL